MIALPHPGRTAPTTGPLPRDLEPPQDVPASASLASWSLSTFAGRLGEICGGRASAALTLAFRLVLDAQRGGEPVAWITRRDRAFYPPDVAEAAVDIEALVVVWAVDARASARAADQLVRSGGFGLVVLDLGEGCLPTPVQARLAGLARKHRAAVLCLTGDGASLGALVSIRAEARRSRRERDRFLCRATVLKDKRRGPGWKHQEVFHGPDGLY